MYETRRVDTREVCVVSTVDKCCETCKHFGFAPDGAGECAMLIDYQDGEPMVTTGYDDPQELSHTIVGGYNICDCWEAKNV